MKAATIVDQSGPHFAGRFLHRAGAFPVTFHPEAATDRVRALAASALENRDSILYAGILADAISETGLVSEELPERLRRFPDAIDLQGLLTKLAHGYDFAPEWTKEQERIAERDAARLRKQIAGICLFSAGVTGCNYDLKELARRITRRRPRGTGSKADLAKRLRELMDRRADQLWKRAIKGQRRPSESDILAIHTAVGSSLNQVQSLARQRTLSVAAVLRVAAEAATERTARIDGGKVTASSYGYAWTTTAASAQRMQDGTIRVRISRGGRDSSFTRDVQFLARHWIAAAACK